MKPSSVIGALLLLFSPAALAQAPAGPPVAFAPVTTVPVPLQSLSGRFNSLNPRNRVRCPFSKVTGRVVSARLMLVDELDCGQPGGETLNVLVNIELSNPADAAQMILGRRITVTGIFRHAQEYRAAPVASVYLMVEKAELIAGDPRTAPVPAFMSYMMCQPPELDALARQLGSDLCVQSTIVANLAGAGPALEAAARAPSKLSPGDTVPGDPDTISCRLDPELSGLHLPAIACAKGSYWSWYKAKWHQPLFPKLAPP